MVQRPEGLAGLHEEDVLVIDLPGGHEGGSKTQMPSENGQRARTQLDAAILAGFSLVPVNAADSCFVDTDESVHEINIGEHEGDLLRRSQAGEEAKLVVVALGFTPLAMNGGYQCFGVVHGEGVDLRSICFAKTGAP
jgi:hypothetical protein